MKKNYILRREWNFASIKIQFIYKLRISDKGADVDPPSITRGQFYKTILM